MRILKVIAVAAVLMLGSFGAHAQVGPEVYKVATPGQIFEFDSNQRDITRAVVHQIVTLMCNQSCIVWPYAGATNNGLPGTLATQGVFMAASERRIFSVTRGSSISVIRDTNSGKLFINEWTK